MSEEAEIRAFFERKAALEQRYFPDDAPPIPIPTLGTLYFVEVLEDAVQVLFTARLMAMCWASKQAGFEQIEFGFDNDVSVAGLPILMPDGYELDRESGCTGMTLYLPSLAQRALVENQ